MLIVIPALLTGFLLNRLWYAWLGVLFLRRGSGGRGSGTM